MQDQHPNWNAAVGQAIAFAPTRPYYDGMTEVPQGLSEDSAGRPLLQIYAPHAQSVHAEFEEYRGEKALALTKREDGVWQAAVPLMAGFYYIQILIDGNAVLSPMLPIGYGYSRPYNFLEILPLPKACQYRDVPHGQVARCYYHSTATNSDESCLIYTPPGYENGGDYPVLYLQHGQGENETGWTYQGKCNFILDNLIAEGRAKPMIVVMNDGMVNPEISPQGLRVDHLSFERRILEDIIPFVEANYRVRADREHRAMAGLSMGSMQTSMTGFLHPDQFAWLGLFSGFMHDLYPDAKNEHLSFLAGRVEEFHRDTRLFFRAMGDRDVFFARFEDDDRFCEENGIRALRKIYQGGHDWNVWRMCLEDFLPLLFQD